MKAKNGIILVALIAALITAAVLIELFVKKTSKK